MKSSIKKEIPSIVIVLLPFIYLAYLWNNLPQIVPIHWSSEGEINGYRDKTILILIPILLSLLVYVIFMIIPKIDPKNKLILMGNKLQGIKLIVTAFMSVLALFILYTIKHQSLLFPNSIILVLGTLYLILGNYFKTIKPNYFIGIRTPWTLENETVWKKTHKMAGKMWFIGGIVIVFTSLVLSKQPNLIVFLIITGVIMIIPLVYSFLQYRKES